jgi:hypothetical protein
VALACVLASCSNETSSPDAGELIEDVRVPIPAADPSFIDLISPDLRIEPGHEAIYCFYVSNTAGRFGSDRVEAVQGAHGHHVAFRRASQHRPDGTFEDCTSDQEALQLGDLFVGGDLPAGWASEIAADAQFVLEMHYQNSGEIPLVARDVIRIHKLPDAQITKWVHPMHLKIYDLVIGPGESTRSFECTVPQDLALYQYWGHQHGLGKRFDVEITPPGEAPRPLYSVVWGVDGTVWGTTASALALTTGTKLRVTCTWNPAGRTIRFPDEMCAFGGIVEGAEFSCAPMSQ